MDLQEKVIVVTGAGSGIGRALCHALVEKGASVAACDVNERAAKETAASLFRSADHGYFTVDVGDREAVLAAAAAVTAVYPGVVKTNLAASAPTYTDEERRRAVEIYHTQPGITPERAASRIVGAIERGTPRVLIGPDAWFVDKLVRLMPARSDRLT